MSKERKPLSWKPKRRGAIYCAPACGNDCTYEQYREAHVKAAALCATLDKTTVKGWKPRVWENLGWHYAATSPCERITVHPAYCAFLGSKGSGTGRWAERGKTPRAAVLAVIKAASADLAEISATLTGIDWA